MTEEYPSKRATRVSLYFKDGTTFCSYTDYPLGEPENPIPLEALENKYDSLMSYAGVLDEKSNMIKHYIKHLPENFDMFLGSL